MLAGCDWQQRLGAVEPKDEPTCASGMLLICDKEADFAAAIRIGIRAFAGEDEDLPDLHAGLCAALHREAFCAAGMLPSLLAALQQTAAVREPPLCCPVNQFSHRELELARVWESFTTDAERKEHHHGQP
jgi:DNA-binding NarL/FixJ family response regulator